MQEEYETELKKFYEIYLPLKRKYNLQLHSHFSIWEDGWIKIYKKTGRQQKLIIKAESESDAACYRMAREQLNSWETAQLKDKKQAG